MHLRDLLNGCVVLQERIRKILQIIIFKKNNIYYKIFNCTYTVFYIKLCQLLGRGIWRSSSPPLSTGNGLFWLSVCEFIKEEFQLILYERILSL